MMKTLQSSLGVIFTRFFVCHAIITSIQEMVLNCSEIQQSGLNPENHAMKMPAPLNNVLNAVRAVASIRPPSALLASSPSAQLATSSEKPCISPLDSSFFW